MNTSSKTMKIVEAAMLMAMAMVLSYLKVYELPQGGSITLEMLPLVVLGLRRGAKWGCAGGLAFGLLQMFLGFSNVLYCNTLLAMIGCVLLDYLLAFTVLGLAPVFANLFSNKVTGYVVGSAIVGLLRFVCSFLSGWLLWGSYAPEGMGAVTYSFVYNGSYMVPNIIIMAVIVGILAKIVPGIFKKQD